MADTKQLLEIARKKRAELQQRFDRLPPGPNGVRSTNPQYAPLKQALAAVEAEIRQMQGARVRERVVAVGKAISTPPTKNAEAAAAFDAGMSNLFNPAIAPELRNAPGALFAQKSLNTPGEREAAVSGMASLPLPPFAAAPPELVSQIVNPGAATPPPSSAAPSSQTPLSGERQGPPAPAQASEAVPSAGAAPQATPAAADPQAQQIDADMAALRSMIAESPPQMVGPVPLSMGERIAAGLIAALDPVSYHAIVLPELARRQQDAAQKYQAAVSAQDSRLARHAQLLTLQHQGQQIGVEREKIAAGREEREFEREQERTQVVTALSSMLPVAQRADRRVAVVAKGLREVGLHDQADALEQQYGEVTDIARPLADNPTATTKSQVGVFEGRLNALDRSIADSQNAIHAERVRRGEISSKAKIPSETDISKYTWGRAALTAIRRARALVQQGHGGPESLGTGLMWWTDSAHKHKELSEQWSMIEASVKPDKFGGALSPTENQIINGILAGTLSLPATQLRALERLETIISSKLREQENIFDFTDESAIVGRGYLTQHQLNLMQSKLSEGWTLASSPEQIEGAQGLEQFEGWVVDPDGFPIMISPDGRPARITPF